VCAQCHVFFCLYRNPAFLAAAVAYTSITLFYTTRSSSDNLFFLILLKALYSADVVSRNRRCMFCIVFCIQQMTAGIKARASGRLLAIFRPSRAPVHIRMLITCRSCKDISRARLRRSANCAAYNKQWRFWRSKSGGTLRPR